MTTPENAVGQDVRSSPLLGFWFKVWELLAQGHGGEKPTYYTLRFVGPMEEIVVLHFSPENAEKIGLSLIAAVRSDKLIKTPSDRQPNIRISDKCGL